MNYGTNNTHRQVVDPYACPGYAAGCQRTPPPEPEEGVLLEELPEMQPQPQPQPGQIRLGVESRENTSGETDELGVPLRTNDERAVHMFDTALLGLCRCELLARKVFAIREKLAKMMPVEAGFRRKKRLDIDLGMLAQASRHEAARFTHHHVLRGVETLHDTTGTFQFCSEELHPIVMDEFKHCTNVKSELRAEAAADLEWLLTYIDEYPSDKIDRPGFLEAATRVWHKLLLNGMQSELHVAAASENTDAEYIRQLQDCIALIMDFVDTGIEARDTWGDTSALTFLEQDLTLEYLIPGILPLGELAMLGGPMKTLKSSVAIDLAMATATGKPFLDYFPVTRPAKTMLMNVESGPGVVQKLICAIANARGVAEGELANLHVVSRDTLPGPIPELGTDKGNRELFSNCVARGVEVVILDPCSKLFAGVMGDNFANLYATSAALVEFEKVAREAGVTCILVHHTTKHSERIQKHEFLELQDLHGAGWSENMRNWMLLSRGAKYILGTGQHTIKMRTGGSAGHSGDYVVSIGEGTPDQLATGRKHWSTVVTRGSEWAAKQPVTQASGFAKRAEEARKLEEEATKLEERIEKALLRLREEEDSEYALTVRTLRDLMGGKTKYKVTLQAMLSRGLVTECITGAKNTPGLKLTEFGLSEANNYCDEDEPESEDPSDD